MMKTNLAKISKETANEIKGQFMNEFSMFNPFEIDDVWYVSIKESEYLKDDMYEIVEIFINFGENETDD
jgi:hypothetical protein